MRKSILKGISLALASLLVCVGLVSCKPETSEEPKSTIYDESYTNIIDDHYRNYYEIFVYSYFDTNNDGIGDINGVTQKLDYIKEMGFNGIWLMPVHEGTSYHKYDVEDYYSIDKDFGTIEDFENLLKEAHARGINVIMDLVVNHTSSNHSWFKEATAYIKQNGASGGKYGDFYNFTTKKQEKYDPVSGTNYYYEARFWGGMPDLNLDSQNVRDEIKNIVKFWLDKGVDGFRLDAVTSYYTGNVPKNVAFIKWLNETVKEIKSAAYIVGEAWEGTHGQVREYYDSGADSFFAFPLATATGGIANVLKDIYPNNGKKYGELLLDLQSIYDTGILAPFLGNHDTARPASFLGQSQTDKIKMAGGLLQMMNGSSFVYYGEEIGMLSKDSGSSDPRKRIAMLWEDKSVYTGMCYKPPENITVTKDSYYYPSVAAQLEDPNSILSYYKHANLLRNQNPEIARGVVEVIQGEHSPYCCVIKKTYNGDSIYLVINLDREYEQTVSLNLSGVTLDVGLVGVLCANADTAIEYNVADNSVYLPSYSIAIFR